MCYVNYELFRGFDPPTTPKDHSHTTTATATHKKVMNFTNNKMHTAHTHKVYATSPKVYGTTTTEKVTVTVAETNSTVKSTGRTIQFDSPKSTETRIKQQWRPKLKVKEFKRSCPETERPLSIGTYEIPTQRDLVLFTKRTLLKMFNSYHTKTLLLLKDIKEATRATVEVENKCRGKKTSYRKCVKQVSKKCISITKDLVESLERQEAEVAALTKDQICDMTSMRTDPIQLIKILAMDEATLDFALPAFLRLLGGCSIHCHKQSPPDRRPRLRQLTDQDLVVRHFLTSKNYMQLIKDTTSYV